MHRKHAFAIRQDRHGDTVAADRRTVDPGHGFAHAPVVDQVAGFEVIGGVQDDDGGAQQLRNVTRDKNRHHGPYLDTGNDRFEALLGCDGLGQGRRGIGLVEENLTLQIAALHVVAIDYRRRPTPARGEQHCLGASQSATADDDGVRLRHPELPFSADARKENLSRITIFHGESGNKRNT